MNRCLPYLLSLLFLLPFAIHAQEPTDTLQKYYMELERGETNISGLLITRQQDGEILGSVVNEFGVSAIDFVFNPTTRKFHLKHVVKFLDKWYIKRTLKKDLAFCIDYLFNLDSRTAGNYIVVTNPDSTCILNRKLNIAYTFSPINSTIDNGI